MSAFVVTQKTINQVLSYLENDRRCGDWFRRAVRDQLGADMATEDGVADLGRDMLALNMVAVQQRYGDKAATITPNDPYAFAFEWCDRYQALKSLNCWLYQCSEGNCPSTALYRLATELKTEWAMAIVSELPQYERAQWDAA